MLQEQEEYVLHAILVIHLADKLVSGLGQDVGTQLLKLLQNNVMIVIRTILMVAQIHVKLRQTRIAMEPRLNVLSVVTELRIILKLVMMLT